MSRSSNYKIKPINKQTLEVSGIVILSDDSLDTHKNMLTPASSTFNKKDKANETSVIGESQVYIEKTSTYSIKEVQCNIIEKYEVDLYYISEKYHESHCGPVSLNDVFKCHLLFNTSPNELFNDSDREEEMKNSFQALLKKDSMIYIRYKIIQDLCHLISSLLLKWGLYKRSKYDYKFIGRSQSAKVLEINKMNLTCFSIETLWFCVAIKEKYLKTISNQSLMQHAEILDDQTNKVFNKLLEVKYNCIPSVEDAVGVVSKQYARRYMKRSPVPYIGKNEYQRLKLPNLISKMVFKSHYNSVLELYDMFKDLETSYRTFEKELIGRFLLMY
jgi:hypothetical protein